MSATPVTAESSKDYGNWQHPVHQWQSPEELLASAAIADGIHAIRLADGTVLDLLLANNPLGHSKAQHVLTFFTGAVEERQGKKGPYFSGISLSEKLELPFISVSDPGLDVDPEIQLAWYAGSLQSNLQDQLALILKGLSERAGRPLLLVGGSGGGFAALTQAERLGPLATAFVWNPQTSILHYNPPAVRKYLRTLGFALKVINADDWIDQVSTRVNGRIQLALEGSGALESTRGLLYLQNWSDSHRRLHLLPWLNWNRWLELPIAGKVKEVPVRTGMPAVADPASTPQTVIYSPGRNHAVVATEFTSGHGAPSRADLIDILKALQFGTATPQQLATRFARHHASTT